MRETICYQKIYSMSKMADLVLKKMDTVQHSINTDFYTHR